MRYGPNRQQARVTVEYLRGTERVTRTYDDARKARAFYVACDRKGLAPKVVAAERT